MTIWLQFCGPEDPKRLQPTGLGSPTWVAAVSGLLASGPVGGAAWMWSASWDATKRSTSSVEAPTLGSAHETEILAR